MPAAAAGVAGVVAGGAAGVVDEDGAGACPWQPMNNAAKATSKTTRNVLIMTPFLA